MLDSVYHHLTVLGLASWPTLWVGYERRFIGRNEVIDFACDLLSTSANSHPAVTLLAGGETLDEIDFVEQLSSLARTDDPNLEDISVKQREVDKWRLAMLVDLRDRHISEDDRFQRLQDLYAEFNYPEDMEKCSQYYISTTERAASWTIGDRTENDPYKEMLLVIGQLESRLLKRSGGSK